MTFIIFKPSGHTKFTKCWHKLSLLKIGIPHLAVSHTGARHESSDDWQTASLMVQIRLVDIIRVFRWHNNAPYGVCDSTGQAGYPFYLQSAKVTQHTSVINSHQTRNRRHSTTAQQSMRVGKSAFALFCVIVDIIIVSTRITDLHA